MNTALSLMETEEKIAKRIDRAASRDLMVSDAAGGVSFADVAQVMEFGKLMAVAGIAVPKHLRGNPGACVAVCVQAIEWRMSPFAVANKSYSVNDRLAFEAQLIHAVIQQRAPIKGRIKVEFAGEGDSRRCRVWAELRDEPGESVEYISPPFLRITPKNSPLWKSDPDQQLFYFSVRSLCRRHFPDVLLGVFARDEVEDAAPVAGSVRPAPASLTERLRSLSGGPRETLEPEEGDDDKDAVETESAIDEDYPDDPLDTTSADYRRGADDRRKGLAKCLSAEIREDEARFRHWKAGYDSAAEDAP
jgi:hypothetical protein